MRFPDVLPYEKRTEKTVSKSLQFSQLFIFLTKYCCTHNHENHIFAKKKKEKKMGRNSYLTKNILSRKKPQLYFDHFIRENSNWILLQFKIWCQFWREISNYLYCNNIHLIKFSDKIVYLISLCVAVDKSDAKDPVWNFCSRRKKKLAKSQRLFSVEIAEVLNPKIGTFQLWVECINIIITA